MRPTVTVVIPVYNKAKYVGRAIQSVLDQTYSVLELLIVDDASTDESMKKVAAFDDPRIRVLSRTKSGPGGYAARNLGIRHAAGDWIGFLDADDFWFPEHIEHAMGVARVFPDVPIISAGRIDQVGTEQKLDPFSERFMPEGTQVLYLADYLQYACKGMRCIQTNTILLKRAALFSYLVFPEGRANRSGDLFAWVQLMAKLKCMVWSPHVAAISYRDVVGVSRTAIPSIHLFRQMVDEFGPYENDKDERWLKSYANKMIKYAWLEARKKRVALPMLLLPRSFYWMSDVPYCLKWTLISLVPFGILEWMKQGFQTD
ncbi:glycosyltransferase family 2 protein [Billgrantia endophytica]|uniref:Glycosyltransferase 2-like domain-containing protein n=1 Tax=Billgrantia endophytica TaxID=2033802 RepID=A0A2N7U968_9GAMM|nr:glycosyltransferase family A protein [Halomonas endophytica]PMR76977.1 hypothetical protein C1H69_04575 [Halomonas endophytica]